MQAIVPDATLIDRVLSVLTSSTAPSDADLAQVLDEPVVGTGLDHWALWTLMCLKRNVDRQEWVGYIVESRLGQDLREIGRPGFLGRPRGLPTSGEVPNEPGWSYQFHGSGCGLTSEVTGVRIEVNFTPDGGCTTIDHYSYSRFLQSLRRPEFPECTIRRDEPLEDAWQIEIDCLAAANCAEAERVIRSRLRLTTLGLSIAGAIEPVSKQIAQLLQSETETGLRTAVYAALALGDAVLAAEWVSRAGIAVELQARIARKSEREKRARARFLEDVLQREAATSRNSNHLCALADLGPEFSEAAVQRCLFQNPVNALGNIALEILCVWNSPDLVVTLKELLTSRYKEATGLAGILRQSAIGLSWQRDTQPRNHQVTRAALFLLQRQPCGSIDSRFKQQVRFLIENAKGAEAGDAALVMYLMDRNNGLRCLRAALSDKVPPVAQLDAAAGCLLIGDLEAKKILAEALSNPNRQIQHTAACALVAFPAEDARDSACRWFAQNTGIDKPSGTETVIEGQTTRVFTFDDISHANMNGFLNYSLERLRRDFSALL